MKTNSGKGVTDAGHFFSADKFQNFISVREVSCLNCTSCKKGVFSGDAVAQCQNLRLCGTIERVMVCLKSGQSDERAGTRYMISDNGIKIAKAVKVDEIVGAECAKDSEPFILFKAMSTAYTVEAAEFETMSSEYKHNWMGEVQVGDLVIKGLKLQDRTAGMYAETDRIFYLFAEDTRGVVKASVLTRRSSARVGKKAAEINIYEVDSASLSLVERAVYLPGDWKPKRPRVLLVTQDS